MIRKSFCRLCSAACGTLVHIDEDDRVSRIVGDVDHPLSKGYTCSKGRALAERHHHPDRLLHPEMQGPHGGAMRVSWDALLDDLADRLTAIIGRHGPDAVGLFMGGGGYTDFSAISFWRQICSMFNTRSIYSDVTIDAASKLLIPELMVGIPGMMSQPDRGRCRLMLFIGMNPSVSHGHTVPLPSPTAQLREITANAEVWVLDPRLTETAARATRHIAPRAGTDYVILAHLIRELLRDGADREYIRTCTQGVEELALAVEPFTLDVAAANSGVGAQDLIDLLAAVRRAGRLSVDTGTGVTMARTANLTQWLSWALMIITGSLDREGGAWLNPGFLNQLEKADIPQAPANGWQAPGPASRPELLSVAGEFPCAAMPDEIEAGNLRALINLSGNPLLSLPDSERTAAALDRLDVLVSIDAFRSETVQLSTHRLPAKDQLERADIAAVTDTSFPLVGTQFTPPMVPPRGEAQSYWWIMAQLARRMGMSFLPEIDPDTATDIEVLRHYVAQARAPLELDGESCFVTVADRHFGWLEEKARAIGGWRLAPPPLLEQLRQVEPPADLVLISRRRPHRFNSHPVEEREVYGISVSAADAEAAGLNDGDVAVVRSGHGELTARVLIDNSLPKGALSIPHGWPGAENVNRLTSGIDGVDRLSGMPLYTGVPVDLLRAPVSSQEL